MTYLWQKCKYLPNPKWFIPVVIGLLIFFSIICIAEGGTMDTSRAVIHHTASVDVSIETVRTWHVVENGWNDVGYHFLIRENGDVEKGRALNKNGAHAKGRNHYVGICLTGNDRFTAQQVVALVRLLQTLKIKHIETHHEKCPGPGFDMAYIRRKI